MLSPSLFSGSKPATYDREQILSSDFITIPKSSLGYKTNNLYANYPPLMSDGRSIVATDQSETIINNQLLNQSGVKTNWEYRRYLTSNSENIRNINTREAYNDVGYYKRFANMTDNNNNTLSSVYNGNSGENQLEQLYKSREQLNSRIYTPSVTEEQIRNLSSPLN